MSWTRATFRATYLRPTILGAVDGLITSFVIVAGGLASDAPTRVTTLIGFSSLVADGISMGVSEGLSSRAQDGELTPKSATLLGCACFLGFVSFGSAPLVGYVIGRTDASRQFLSAFFFLSFLILTGAFRGVVAQQTVWKAVAEVVLLGSVAGGVAYGIASI